MAIDYNKFLSSPATPKTSGIDFNKFLPQQTKPTTVYKKEPTQEDFDTLDKYMGKAVRGEKAKQLINEISNQKTQEQKLEEVYQKYPNLRPTKPESFLSIFGKELAKNVFPVISEIEKIPETEPLLTDKNIVSKIIKEVPNATVKIAQDIAKYTLGLPLEFGLDFVNGIKELSGGKSITEIDTKILGKVKPYSSSLPDKFERGKALAEVFGAQSETAKNIGGLVIPFITEDILRAVATGGAYAKIGTSIGKSVNYTKVGDFNIKNADYTPPGAEKTPKIKELIFGKQKEATITLKDNKGQVGFAEVKQSGNDINVKLYAPKSALKPTQALTTIPTGGQATAGAVVPVSPIAGAGAVAPLKGINYNKILGAEQAKTPDLKVAQVKDLNRPLNEQLTKQTVEQTLAGQREDFRIDTPEKAERLKDVLKGKKPDDIIPIYRATTKKTLSEGDHITVDPELAKDYKTKREGSKIIADKVKVKDLVSSRGLRSEFIYAPKKVEPIKIDPLILEKEKEAKKFKTAEEFVEAQPKVYHGTVADFDKFKLQGGKELGPDALFFSPQKEVAEYYAQGIGKDGVPKIKEATIISKNIFDYKNKNDFDKLWNKLKIKTKDEIMGFETSDYITMEKIKNDILKGKYNIIEKPVVQNAIKEIGYDGFKILDYTGGDAIGIFNIDAIKTKSQLTDIFNQAKAEAPKAKPKKPAPKEIKLTPEEERVILEKTFEVDKQKDFFEEEELENQYQNFRKLRLTRLDEIEDVQQLKAKRPSAQKEQIDNILYSQKISADEIFNMFKDRLLKERGIKLTSGIDPGIDKFIAEDIMPLLDKAKEAGTYLKGIKNKIADVIWGKFKPIIPAEKAVGREVPATIIKGIHKPEAFVASEWNNTELKNIDENIASLEKWFNLKFKPADLENLMLSRGTPETAEGSMLKAEATKALPPALRRPEITNAINEIADINYDFLTKVVGDDISKVEDYFYGIYDNNALTTEFLENWKTTKRFLKEKKFPVYADARAFGLKLKSKNPIDNLRSEAMAIARLEAMEWLKNELLRTGKGIYIDEQLPAPRNWVQIKDEPVFKGLRLEPNLGRMFNSLIQANKISKSPTLNFIRKVNNTLRTLKFVGSAFHLGVEAKQAIADTGYLKIGLKPTSYRGLDRGFKDNDPIFKTEVYKDYLEQGGGHEYSIDAQAQKGFSDLVDKINRGNYLGGLVRVPMIPVNINRTFINWMFTKYIPKLKYAKYLDNVAIQETKKGRALTNVEKQDIIREGQNFYGEMNERLFGRSGTVTSALRFVFMAPGFAEGNFTTMVKAATEWGQGGRSAARSRSNMINSLILTAMLATAGTLIFSKKKPKKPKTIEDIRDIFKIDTGKQDDKGREIMIDLLTYDKDYFEVLFKTLLGKPGEAINYSIQRIGGMEATTLGLFSDIASLIQGEKLIDWKDDPVFYDTDDFQEKALKIAIHEMKRLEPISFSVYRQSRQKGVSRIISGIEALSGVRPTFTDEEKRKQKSLSQIYDLKGRQEELYYVLRTTDNPREKIKDYNDKVNQVLNSSIIPKDFKDEWSPKLLIDTDKLLSNKLYDLGQAQPDDKTKIADYEENQKKIKEFLKNFDVKKEDVKRLLDLYYDTHPVKNRFSKTNMTNRRERKSRIDKNF